MNNRNIGLKDILPVSQSDKELEAIKRLLVLLLLKAGASQEEIGAALDRDASRISRMFPGTKIKKFGEKK